MRLLNFVEAHSVHTARIARHMAGRGHDVAVLAFHDFVGDGLVHVVRRRPWSEGLPLHHHWTGISSVVRFARSFRPDIVHGHYLTTAAVYLAALRGPATIASAMGSDVLVDPAAFHARFLLRRLPRWVDRFTSVAPHVTRRMIELGIDRESIVTFPWGVDVLTFHPPERSPSGQTVISTRNLEPVYDVSTLIEAFADVVTTHRDVRLRILGHGSLRRNLEMRADAHGLSGRIRFDGHVSEGDTARSLREASVYVSTATSDGASTSLLEAMATGLLPVVSDIEANRDWIQDGQNGLLFRPGDSGSLAAVLRRALADDALRSRCLRINPELVANRATWADSMRRLDAVYGGVSA